MVRLRESGREDGDHGDGLGVAYRMISGGMTESQSSTKPDRERRTTHLAVARKGKIPLPPIGSEGEGESEARTKSE